MVLRPSDVGETLAPVVIIGDDRLRVVTEDEIALTPDAARVLARIVRQHLDRDGVTPGLRLVGHAGAPHRTSDRALRRTSAGAPRTTRVLRTLGGGSSRSPNS